LAKKNHAVFAGEKTGNENMISHAARTPAVTQLPRRGILDSFFTVLKSNHGDQGGNPNK